MPVTSVRARSSAPSSASIRSTASGSAVASRRRKASRSAGRSRSASTCSAHAAYAPRASRTTSICAAAAARSAPSPARSSACSAVTPRRRMAARANSALSAVANTPISSSAARWSLVPTLSAPSRRASRSNAEPVPRAVQSSSQRRSRNSPDSPVRDGSRARRRNASTAASPSGLPGAAGVVASSAATSGRMAVGWVQPLIACPRVIVAAPSARRFRGPPLHRAGMGDRCVRRATVRERRTANGVPRNSP
jgi:hypothetical protein